MLAVSSEMPKTGERSGRSQGRKQPLSQFPSTCLKSLEMGVVMEGLTSLGISSGGVVT